MVLLSFFGVTSLALSHIYTTSIARLIIGWAIVLFGSVIFTDSFSESKSYDHKVFQFSSGLALMSLGIFTIYPIISPGFICGYCIAASLIVHASSEIYDFVRSSQSIVAQLVILGVILLNYMSSITIISPGLVTFSFGLLILHANQMVIQGSKVSNDEQHDGSKLSQLNINEIYHLCIYGIIATSLAMTGSFLWLAAIDSAAMVVAGACLSIAAAMYGFIYNIAMKNSQLLLDEPLNKQLRMQLTSLQNQCAELNDRNTIVNDKCSDLREKNTTANDKCREFESKFKNANYNLYQAHLLFNRVNLRQMSEDDKRELESKLNSYEININPA